MFRSDLSAGWLFVCFISAFVLCRGRADADDRTELSDWLRTAAEELDPSTLPAREECAAEFEACMTQVTNFLTSQRFDGSGGGWLDYLQLDAMSDAIASNVNTQEQIKLADALHRRLIGPIPGVELAPLMKLREQTNYYRCSLLCSDRESFIDHLRTQLIEIAGQLDADSGAGSTVFSAKEIRLVSKMVAQLCAFHQSASSVERIQRIFAYPNCMVTLSEGLVQQAIGRSVDEIRPINDCILGTRILGQAKIHADVAVDLQPSIDVAQLTIILHSQMRNQSRGYQGPVALNMIGGGQAIASRTLLLNDEGVTLQPVRVEVNLTNEIQSIEHPLRIVRRIASRRAAKQKPQADQIAESKVQAEIRDQVAKETDAAGTLRPDDLLAPLRPWLHRFAVSEPRRTWGSTEHSMFIQGHLLKSDQIASPVAPPKCSVHGDAVIQIHETCVNHVMGAYMSGRTVSEQNLDLLIWLSGRGPLIELPIEVEVNAVGQVDIQVHPITPEFQIVLMSENPVFLEAREGRVVMGAHVAKIVQDGTAPINDVEVRATYRPRQQFNGYYHLARESEVEINVNELDSLSEMQRALLVEVREAFQRVLPLKIADQDFMLPPRVPTNSLKDRHFRPDLIESQDGWLTIAFR